MKRYVRIGLFIVGLIAFGSLEVQANPPFGGTIFIDPDIITSSDPTTFQSAS